MNDGVTIEIRGAKGTGKTALLNLIGHYLKRRGLNVVCVDEMCRQMTPIDNDRQLDSREVLIRTLETFP